MVQCPECNAKLSDALKVCPSCGRALPPAFTSIDEYVLEEFLSEGPDSAAYRGRRPDDGTPRFIRIYKPDSGVGEETAGRIEAEIETIRPLSRDRFVQHDGIRKSADGRWYRVSEWHEAVKWGDLIASGYFLEWQQAAETLATVADGLDELHRQGATIPHLTLDDLLAVREDDGGVHVRIDYKLSRIINPALPNPRPELAALLAAHPDILGGRALDFRTDTWTLGRIFAKLLTGEDHHHSAQDKLESSNAPPRLKTLIRQMLDPDPGDRPATMSVVARTLREAAEEERERLSRERAAARHPRLILALLALLITAGAVLAVLQFRYGIFTRDAATRLSRQADKYKGAVAFVVVAYALEVDGKEVARSGGEGSAFLVSEDGYFLTNRHVACPWMLDEDLAGAVSKHSRRNAAIRLKYRLLLWMEGQRAMRRGRPERPLKNIDDYLEENYFVETAYRTGGTPSLRLAGILPPPRTLRENLRSPLGDDIAVLKIERAPAGVRPFPLPDRALPLPKPLDPVMVLGFPLGSEQNFSAEAVPSATTGTIRRSFENIYQIDASIHSGNSGGPVVDASGRLLGIASATAARGLLGGLSDFGMVMPVEKALPLLAELRRGVQKWDGAPYYGLSGLSVKASAAATKGDWRKALQLVSAEAVENRDPNLLELLAVVQYGSGDSASAARTLDLAISAAPERVPPRLLRHAIEWRRQPATVLRDSLIQNAGWQSRAEFGRFCHRAMKGEVGLKDVATGWETRSEKTMLLWISAIRNQRDGNRQEALSLLRQALAESEPESIEHLLALADLASIGGGAASSGVPEKSSAESARRRALKSRAIAAMIAAEVDGDANAERISGILDLLDADPDDGYILSELAFGLASLGRWEAAVRLVNLFDSRPHRPSAVSLCVWLLRAEALAAMGERQRAETELKRIAGHNDWPWYPRIAADLLRGGAAIAPPDSPEEALTLATARGLWAEIAKDEKAAVRHYRAALDTYLSSWTEYRFSAARLEKLIGPAPEGEDPAKPETGK